VVDIHVVEGALDQPEMEVMLLPVSMPKPFL
jgi:hypothetical protein